MPLQESERAVRDLLRQHGIRLHDAVVAELATRAEVERLHEALDEIVEMDRPSEIHRLIRKVRG